MRNSSTSVSVGSASGGGRIGFLGLLSLLFIALKLLNVIDWSWWWVLSPMLIPAALGVHVMIGIVVAVIIKSLRK